MRRTALLAPLFIALAACGPDVRSDGFTQRITTQCGTIGGCEATLEDAKVRVARCGAPSSDSCVAAREDLASVERLMKHHTDDLSRRQAAQRAHADAREAKARTDSENTAQAPTDPPSIHAAAMKSNLADCKQTSELGKCANDGATPDEKATCETECKRWGAEKADAMFRAQLKACLADAEIQSKPACQPDGRPWAPKERLAECNRRCSALAPKMKTYMAQKTKCCDGTRSPTCTYAKVFSDCCSDHGGVCPEPSPLEGQLP